MTTDGAREFDFSETVRFIGVLTPIAFAAWIGLAVWTSTDQPRWFVLGGAAAIAVGAAYYAWAAWSRLVVRATVDERRLRVVTASGREHVVERADLEVRGFRSMTYGSTESTGIARLFHPGGVLYVAVFRSDAVEFVNLLDGSRAWG
jgi:hypothetical protein